MRPAIVLTALVATATASPFRLLGLPAATTSTPSKTPSKDKTADAHNFDQNKQHHDHHVHDEEMQTAHKVHQTVKLTHHRLPLHGNDYGYSYRFQRSNTNPGKAVFYAPDKATAVKGTHKASHGTHSKNTNKHHSRASDNVDVAGLTEPPPCQPMSPPPDEAATKARFDQFAHAFLVTKNITVAFTYISQGYIVS
jgi:hypothetical protein